MNLLTVCICTFNRANSLRRTLDSLVRQTSLNGIDWELLLIDNNSSDQTSQVADEFRTTLPTKYVFEPEQGLSAARNRALREFGGDLLVFTDDDVVFDHRWLITWATVSSLYPETSFFGGRILPDWQGARPAWLTDSSMALISGLLGQYDLGEEERLLLQDDPLPFGANFAVRRQVIDALQPFRRDLGVKGGSAGRGEETEYLQRALNAGFSGRYVAKAVCFHFQDPQRFRLRYLYRYGIESGRAVALTNPSAFGSWVEELAFLIHGVWQQIKGRGDRFRQCMINAGIQRGIRTAHRNKGNQAVNVRN